MTLFIFLAKQFQSHIVLKTVQLYKYAEMTQNTVCFKRKNKNQHTVYLYILRMALKISFMIFYADQRCPG